MSIREDIKAYLDGELSPERMEQVRVALEADPTLRAEAEAFRGITTRIQGAVTMPPVTGLEKALKAAPKAQPWYLAPWAIAAPVGACVIAAVAMSLNSFGGLREAETTAMSINDRGRVTASPSAEMRSESSPARKESVPAPTERVDTSVNSSETQEPWFATDESKIRDGLNAGLNDKEVGTRGMAPSTLNGAEHQGRQQSSSMPGGQILRHRDRDVIRNATMTVTVEDARESKDKLVRDIEEAKGFVEISELHADEKMVISHVKARVPVNAFSGVLAQARAMGELKAENATGEDVTLEIVDADARIKELRIKEEQFRILLGKTKKMNEILQIKERIGNVRGDIASLTAQRDTLKNMADMSFLDATFEQPKDGSYVGKKSGDWADDSWSGAVGRFDKVWQFVATALMNLLTLAPFWLPVVGVLWWLRIKALKSA